jgi:hypothetical protein
MVEKSTENGYNCSDDETLCGGYLCIPNGNSCPVSEIKFSTTTDSDYESNEIIPGSLYILYKRIENTTTRPLV